MPAKVQPLEISAPRRKPMCALLFADLWPYVLKRESATSDPDGKTSEPDNVE